MEEKLPGIYDISKKFYDKMSFIVENMIKFAVENNYIYNKEEVMSEFDHYVQAYLFIVAYCDENLDDLEMSFVKDIVKYDDMFKEFTFERLKKMSEDQKNKVNDICEDIVKKVPKFVEISLICDKIYDSRLKVLEQTNCQIIYDYLLRLSNYLKYVDGFVYLVEDKTSRRLIQPVRDYYLKNYATFAPKRKQED